MPESDNSMERPDKPQTDTDVGIGYDEKFWNWTKAIETMSIGFRNELRAIINKLGVRDGGGGTTTLFAKITANSDAKNYTASIYTKSDLSDTPVAGKSVFVMSLVDTMANASVIPVQRTTIEGKDYECTQQLGLLEKV
jgi:hypothetical protein